MSTRSLPLILVVDDESKIRRLLTKELEANGFDVVCAGDGEQHSKSLLNPIRLPILF